jgi:large subunit ribosomal protein L15
MSEFNIKRPKGAVTRKKILGRGTGTGHGKTAGKGTKGQNARSGGGVRPGFEGGQMPLFRRVARRGFSNYPFKKEYLIVNVRDLDTRFADGDRVDRKSLVARRLIKGKDLPIKLLGDGEVTRKLIVAVDQVSSSAREKIEKSGGEIVSKENKEKRHGK